MTYTAQQKAELKNRLQFIFNLSEQSPAPKPIHVKAQMSFDELMGFLTNLPEPVKEDPKADA